MADRAPVGLRSPLASQPSGSGFLLSFIHCWGALLGWPNDEALPRHRLWARGLRDCLWSAEVIHSRWIAELEERNRVHDRHDPNRFVSLRHYVLLFKDSTFEGVARDVEVTRGTPNSVLKQLKRT